MPGNLASVPTFPVLYDFRPVGSPPHVWRSLYKPAAQGLVQGVTHHDLPSDCVSPSSVPSFQKSAGETLLFEICVSDFGEISGAKITHTKKARMGRTLGKPREFIL